MIHIVWLICLLTLLNTITVLKRVKEMKANKCDKILEVNNKAWRRAVIDSHIEEISDEGH